MIDGRYGGSGTYSFRSASQGRSKVQVSHMPEDSFKVRVSFFVNGDITVPILNISDTEAELLWVALNAMAKDLKWDESMRGN